MVGGGIGVTPYASILNDLVFGTSTNRYSGVACKKVYFLWICPSHRYFEWFIDVLRSDTAYINSSLDKAQRMLHLKDDKRKEFRR